MVKNVLKKVATLGLVLCIVAGTALFAPLAAAGVCEGIVPDYVCELGDDED